MDLTTQLTAHTPSPIQRLPLEIVSLIFLHSLPPELRAHRVQDAPLLLGRVNHGWRDIAKSTPQLWTNIYVRIRNPFCGLKVVAAWLEWSGSKPLDVTLEEGRFFRKAGDTDKILNHLALHSSRWRSLHCKLPAKGAQLVFDESARFGGFPSLEQFVLDCPPSSPSCRWEPPLLSLCPKLLSATFCVAGQLLGNPEVPVYNLEEVQGNAGSSLPNTFHLLQNSPSLRTFSVQFIDRTPFLQPITPFTHTALTELGLTLFSNHGQVDRFLRNITLPSLQTLKLCSGEASVYYFEVEVFELHWPNSLPRFLQRSPVLQDIRFDGCMEKSMPSECVLNTPNLRVLEPPLDASDEVLELLTCQNAPEEGLDVAPYLTGLWLKCTDPPPSPNRLAEMVASRWGGPSGRFPNKGQLLRLDLELIGVRIKDIDTPELSRCIGEGLQVSFDVDGPEDTEDEDEVETGSEHWESDDYPLY